MHFHFRNEKEYENFSSTLTSNLRNQIKHMKMMKQFLTTCASEAVVSGKIDMNEVSGGLGLAFEFPGDPKKLKEKSKMKLWKKYFDGSELSSYI